MMEKELSRISRDLRAIQWTLWFLVAFGIYEFLLSLYLGHIGSEARALDVQSALAYVLIILGILFAGFVTIVHRLCSYVVDMKRRIEAQSMEN